MTYYQLLQQRREALKLSIQDVADQTRLAPQYLQAIENNNLSIFNNDYDFIRSFIQSYCDAIGVNYAALSAEVESNIQSYAMASTAPAAPQRQVRKKRQTKKQKATSSSLYNIYRNLMRSKNARVYQLIALAISMIMVLSIINLVLTFSANRKAAAEEEARQAEIAKKEAETQKLAEKKKAAEKKKEITIENTDKENNVFELSNVLEGTGKLNFTITMPEESTVVFYINDELVDDAVDSISEETFKKTISVDQPCTVQLEIGNYKNNVIKINGKTAKFSKANWNDGSPAVMYFDVVGEAQTDEDSTEEEDSIYSEEGIEEEE